MAEKKNAKTPKNKQNNYKSILVLVFLALILASLVSYMKQ
jgi:hypothetical protein